MKYRFLKRGEVLRAGDEWLGTITGKWRKTQNPSARAIMGKYRRPIPAEKVECLLCGSDIPTHDLHQCECGVKLCPYCHSQDFRAIPNKKEES